MTKLRRHLLTILYNAWREAWWWNKGLKVRLGVLFGQYLHFFCFHVYCHITSLCFLCQPIMVKLLTCKIYSFPWRCLLFCLHFHSIVLNLLFLFRFCPESALAFGIYYFRCQVITQLDSWAHISSSGILRWTFNNSLVHNLSIGNKDKDLTFNT